MATTSEERAKVMDDILSSIGVPRRDTWGASPPAKPLAPDWDYEAVVIHNTGHGHIDTMKKSRHSTLSIAAGRISAITPV